MSRVAVHPTVTILSGPVRDQAELHGILNRLLGLDLELIDVHRLAGDRVPDDQVTQGRQQRKDRGDRDEPGRPAPPA